MGRRRFMKVVEQGGGGDFVDGMVYYLSREGYWEHSEDTGMKLFSDDYPTWTLFTHQDIKPIDDEANWGSVWSMWQNNDFGIKESGMDIVSAGQFANDWSRGYGLRVRDAYNDYGKTFNNGRGTVNSIWTGDCFWFTQLNVAVRRTTSGYYVSLNGTDWTFLMTSFPKQDITFKVGSKVYSEGTTEIALWLSSSIDVTSYFAKYQ